MSDYCQIADDFYLNLHLNTEMELPGNRDTVLHYFEQMKKRFPTMRNFYSRDRYEFVLEEDKDSGSYRWMSVEQKRICSGYVNPPVVSDAVGQHLNVLDSVPHLLSISPLDCESLNVTFGFDFRYQGNHHEVIAEALGVSDAFESLAAHSDASMVAFEPSMQLALDDDCRTQCRISTEARTTAYHVRTGDYPDEAVSIYLTLRSYGSLDSGDTYASRFSELIDTGQRLLDGHVTDNILRPLQQAIAIK